MVCCMLQDKYERELMLHAADVEALSALKRQMEGFHGQLHDSDERCRAAQHKLTELEVLSTRQC